MTNDDFPAYDPDSGPAADISVLSQVDDAPLRADAQVCTVQITLPPGSPGSPPHRHSGPVFGYLVKGAMRFEVEGEPERVIRAGEAFWEPGGDLIHYQDANALDDAETVFVVTMMLAPGDPLLVPVEQAELDARKHLRAPRA